MSLNGLMFSSIPAPRMSLVSGGPLFYTYVWLMASVPGRAARTQRHQSAHLKASSDPIRGTRHESRRVSHEEPHRRRQLSAACGFRAHSMCDFISTHCLKYGTAAGVILWQSREMVVEMA